ncbi:MAG: hypothetical protein IRY92_05705, partial [Dactylosporangium sp.]|nr:hypothetical protein [Dactylosporangium sp.]
MKLPSLHTSPWIGTLFYCGVLLTAAIGSSLAAVHWLGWPLYFAIPVILLGELAGVYLMQIADQRRRLGEQAYAARALSTAVALGMTALNWFGHPDNPLQAGFFAGASALGYATWVIRSGARRRDQLRADGRLPETPPAYGLWRWIRHPLATAEARQIAQQHPDLGLYGSLEVVRLRPVIKPWLRKLLTEIHGKESAAFMIAIMDAKGMADMVRDLIRFDVIARALAHTINAPYLTESGGQTLPATVASPIQGPTVAGELTAAADHPDPAPDGQATAAAVVPGAVNGHGPATDHRAAPARQRGGEQVQARVSRRPAIGGYRKGSDEERIAKAQELARRNLDGRVSVRELARELGIGREAAAR